MSWQVVAAIVCGVLLVWGALVVTLYLVGRRSAEPIRLVDTLRLVPDVLRLLRRLAADRTLPRRVRVELGIVLLYLASPIDLIPVFISIVGYADDVIVVMIALRAVTRAAGPEAISRHWPGTPKGLVAVKQLAGISD